MGRKIEVIPFVTVSGLLGLEDGYIYGIFISVLMQA